MSAVEVESVRARSEVLRGQIDSMMEDLRTRTARLATAQEAIATSTAQARSADGSVEVVVNASGALVGVKFSAAAFSRTTPRKLAVAVLATAGLAAADMRRQNAEILRPFIAAAQVDLPDLIPGAPSLREGVPVGAGDDDVAWNCTVLRSAGNA